MLADALLREGAVEEALERLHRLVELRPEDPGALADLGSTLASSGAPEAAITPLERAVGLAPAWAEAHYNLANALKDANRYEAATVAYREAIACKPGLRPAHVNLGNTLIELGDTDGAFAAYEEGNALRRGPDAPLDSNDRLAVLTTVGKLRHDIEQFEHLRQKGRIESSAGWRVEAHRAALQRIETAAVGEHMVPVAAEVDDPILQTYNRAWHKYAPTRSSEDVLNKSLDVSEIEARYAESGPGIVAIDSLLRPEALRELRRFCLESTIWHEFRYANGYLGAFMQDGFTCPLLAQVAEALRSTFPAIFRHHLLRKTWAFKCDDHADGVPLHADFAAANVNFWITPDDANLDAESGGLTIWDHEAPADWDFEAYNNDIEASRRFITETGAKPIFISYRENRVAIFNSDLLHETQPVRFRPGYESRRINITMLYGRRQDAG